MGIGGLWREEGIGYGEGDLLGIGGCPIADAEADPGVGAGLIESRSPGEAAGSRIEAGVGREVRSGDKITVSLQRAWEDGVIPLSVEWAPP